ncbi:MAG: TetR/AcrR family transcriptional regulator [Balneolaceae bacterium]|nr:MAG: TetR/AcrR family transcriptional regulator [Balneolaceae bacterium]
MGTAERKEREKEKRRNDIVDAAERVFFLKGIDSTTMDDIAEAAELSKGTLYLYFRNKLELLAAIHHRGLTLLTALIAEVLARPITGLEMVRAFSNTLEDFSKKNENYYHFFVHMESVDMASLEPIMDGWACQACNQKGNEIITYLTRAFQIGIQDGTIKDKFNPAMLAIQFLGATRGLIQLSYFHRSGHIVAPSLENITFDARDLLRNFNDLMIEAIKNEKI